MRQLNPLPERTARCPVRLCRRWRRPAEGHFRQGRKGWPPPCTPVTFRYIFTANVSSYALHIISYNEYWLLLNSQLPHCLKKLLCKTRKTELKISITNEHFVSSFCWTLIWKTSDNFNPNFSPKNTNKASCRLFAIPDWKKWKNFEFQFPRKQRNSSGFAAIYNLSSKKWRQVFTICFSSSSKRIFFKFILIVKPLLQFWFVIKLIP